MSSIDHRHALHRIPEIGHKEFKTTQYLLNVFKSLPSWTVEQPLATGLIAFKKGTKSQKCIAFRTDIDALPMTELTGVEHCSEHEGFMHACGHDVHMAGVLGLAEYLTEHPCEEDVLLIFQPAEEGPGGALPMIQAGILDKYHLDEIYALHVSPEHLVGTIASKPGVLFVSSNELHVDLHGKSCHGALPHQGNDMIVAGMQLINQLQTIVSRNINPAHCAVVTVGKFNAGTRLNIVTDHARIEGTLRVMDNSDMDIIKGRITDMVEGVARSFNAQYELDFGKHYSAVNNDVEKYRIFKDKVEQIPGIKFVECTNTMASEDFGFFLERVPGVMFWLGTAENEEAMQYGLHHPKHYPSDRALEYALQVFKSLLTF